MWEKAQQRLFRVVSAAGYYLPEFLGHELRSSLLEYDAVIDERIKNLGDRISKLEEERKKSEKS
jgi:hypothetical protein